MKKGCFLKIIVIITILTAIILYIIQNKFDEFILEPGRKIFSGIAENEIRKELSHVKDSPEKDSLIVIAKYFYNSVIEEEIPEDLVKSTEQKVKRIIEDSIITPGELQEIKTIIESLK